MTACTAPRWERIRCDPGIRLAAPCSQGPQIRAHALHPSARPPPVTGALRGAMRDKGSSPPSAPSSLLPCPPASAAQGRDGWNFPRPGAPLPQKQGAPQATPRRGGRVSGHVGGTFLLAQSMSAGARRFCDGRDADGAIVRHFRARFSSFRSGAWSWACAACMHTHNTYVSCKIHTSAGRPRRFSESEADAIAAKLTAVSDRCSGEL